MLPVHNMKIQEENKVDIDRELVEGWQYDSVRDRYAVEGRHEYSLASIAYKKLLPYQRRELCVCVCVCGFRTARMYIL